jgi:hypothetical protein
MTAKCINETPDKWLDFYPHTEFEEICKTLLSILSTGAKSVWITGNYEPASQCRACIQKLFMDDDTRVRQWLDNYPSNGYQSEQVLKRPYLSDVMRVRLSYMTMMLQVLEQAMDYGAFGKGIIAALTERKHVRSSDV